MHEVTACLGSLLIPSYNLSVYWHPPSSRIVGNLLRLPPRLHLALGWLPERMI